MPELNSKDVVIIVALALAVILIGSGFGHYNSINTSDLGQSGTQIFIGTSEITVGVAILLVLLGASAAVIAVILDKIRDNAG